MTEPTKSTEGGELGFETSQPEPQPADQQVVKEGQTQPEQIPSGPESQQPFQIPDRFRGKSTEDVAKSYVELDKMHGKANERIDKLSRELNQIKSAILASQQQGQMRTVGPDRQPQFSQPSTSLEDKGNFHEQLLGDQGEPYLKQTIRNEFTTFLQGLQHHQIQELDKTRQMVLQTGDGIVRSLAEESDIPYEQVDKMVLEELQRDQDLMNRLRWQPQTFGYEEIDKSVKDLFKKAKENKGKAFKRDLKDYGEYDPESARQFQDAKKRAASSAVPEGGTSTQGGNASSGEKHPLDLWYDNKI